MVEGIASGCSMDVVDGQPVVAVDWMWPHIGDTHPLPLAPPLSPQPVRGVMKIEFKAYGRTNVGNSKVKDREVRVWQYPGVRLVRIGVARPGGGQCLAAADINPQAARYLARRLVELADLAEYAHGT